MIADIQLFDHHYSALHSTSRSLYIVAHISLCCVPTPSHYIHFR